MADPKEQAAKQLANIEKDSGKKLKDFAAAIKKQKLEKHGQMVSFLKSEFGLGHGNANLVAHLVREQAAGGPADDGDLLEAQYTGAKSALRPIYDKLAGIAETLGKDVEKVVQKTGVSFRRAKQFALVQAPSAKRVQLSLNLPKTPRNKRVVETKGMCTHKVDIGDISEVDKDVAGWISSAYEAAAKPRK
ncbi:MAG: DUF5655 domain-containing protein [Planctomycetota bacterium]